MTEYDYIIVGGGSSGCVMASRLSENRAHQVLLIESGHKDSHPWIHVPATFFKVIEKGRDIVAYVGEKDPNVNNRDSIVLQGRVSEPLEPKHKRTGLDPLCFGELPEVNAEVIEDDLGALIEGLAGDTACQFLVLVPRLE